MYIFKLKISIEKHTIKPIYKALATFSQGKKLEILSYELKSEYDPANNATTFMGI